MQGPVRLWLIQFQQMFYFCSFSPLVSIHLNAWCSLSHSPVEWKWRLFCECHRVLMFQAHPWTCRVVHWVSFYCCILTQNWKNDQDILSVQIKAILVFTDTHVYTYTCIYIKAHIYLISFCLRCLPFTV